MQNFAELSDMVHKYCAMESTGRLQQMWRESIPGTRPSKAQAKWVQAIVSPEHNPVRRRNKPRTVLDELLDKPCPIHSAPFDANPSHRLRTYWVVRQVAKSGENILGLTPPNRRSAPTPHDNNVLTVYETFSSNNQRKRAL